MTDYVEFTKDLTAAMHEFSSETWAARDLTISFLENTARVTQTIMSNITVRNMPTSLSKTSVAPRPRVIDMRKTDNQMKVKGFITKRDGVEEDTGTADAGGGSKELIDATKSWTTNEWTGATVTILTGTGSGESKTVASNDGTTLTVTADWDDNPDATSTYKIEVDYSAEDVKNQLIAMVQCGAPLDSFKWRGETFTTTTAVSIKQLKFDDFIPEDLTSLTAQDVAYTVEVLLVRSVGRS